MLSALPYLVADQHGKHTLVCNQRKKKKIASAKDNKSMDYSFKEKKSDFNIKELHNFKDVKTSVSKHVMHLKFCTLVQVLIKLD